MESNHKMIRESLLMRANYIETGNIALSRNDAIAMKSLNLIKPLDMYQEKFVINLRELAEKFND